MKTLIIIFLILLFLFCKEEEKDNTNKLLAVLAIAGSRSNSTVIYSCPNCIVTTFAGSGAFRSTDGLGSAASFDTPSGLAIDSNDNIYVVDNGSSKIRKITVSGVVSTLAGSGSFGSTDGNGISASFNFPSGITVDSNGIAYVADSTSGKIRKITQTGIVSTFAGSGYPFGSVDGTGIAASFYYPNDVAVTNNGTVFVTDSFNSKIRKITSDGAVTTFAGNVTLGSTDGIGVTANFEYPKGITIDSNEIIYVTDGNNKIRKITSDGRVSTFAGSGLKGSSDGRGTAASFYYPNGIAVDKNGIIYIADSINNKIRRITTDGIVTTFAGSGTTGFANGTASTAWFYRPEGVAVDKNGNVYVADTGNSIIRKITLP